MRILYLINGLTVGGAEIITIDIANEMAAKGHKVCLAHILDKNELKNRIDSSVEVISLCGVKSFFSLFKATIKFGKIIKEFKPDIVHANMFHANIIARISRIFHTIPKLICSAHSNNEGGSLRMLTYRMTDFLSDINTNVSEKAIEHFVNNKWFSKKKSICVYNGINVNIFKPDENTRNLYRSKYSIKPEDFLFLYVRRLTKIKDVSTLLNAFQIVSTQKENVKLLIVGEGEEKTNLENQSKELGIENLVTFAGKQNDTWNYYNAADCFVLTSSWEGFGIVLVEAMSCGLPVLATNAGGCAEIINDNNYMIEVGDFRTLSDKMLSISRLDSASLSKIKEHNIIRAGDFSIETILDKWMNVYNK